MSNTVRIISDNENYIDYLNQDLVITSISTNESEHPGYDYSVNERLFDLKTLNGEDVPFSLYEYEVEFVERSNSKAKSEMKIEYFTIDNPSYFSNIPFEGVHLSFPIYQLMDNDEIESSIYDALDETCQGILSDDSFDEATRVIEKYFKENEVVHEVDYENEEDRGTMYAYYKLYFKK